MDTQLTHLFPSGRCGRIHWMSGYRCLHLIGIRHHSHHYDFYAQSTCCFIFPLFKTCVYFLLIYSWLGLPRWLNCKESPCQCRRHVFDPWIRKIPLEEGMATHSSILAWRVPWTEKPGGLQSMGSQRVPTRLSDWLTHTHTPIKIK